mmetsp:Transcript_14531/g.47738  ORF Transcript_14531/g.47738 Transcript_14531/m.47738 type:complete len:226 (+) Transcript_14531:215-892(+)
MLLLARALYLLLHVPKLVVEAKHGVVRELRRALVVVALCRVGKAVEGATIPVYVPLRDFRIAELSANFDKLRIVVPVLIAVVNLHSSRREGAHVHPWDCVERRMEGDHSFEQTLARERERHSAAETVPVRTSLGGVDALQTVQRQKRRLRALHELARILHQRCHVARCLLLVLRPHALAVKVRDESRVPILCEFVSPVLIKLLDTEPRWKNDDTRPSHQALCSRQ